MSQNHSLGKEVFKINNKDVIAISTDDFIMPLLLTRNRY